MYDNGSSMYPKLNTDERLKAVLCSEEEINKRIYQFPTSQVKINGQKSSYSEVISSLKYEECNNALKRICPRVDFVKINKIIDEIDNISETRKNFYKIMYRERFEKILNSAYKKLI